MQSAKNQTRHSYWASMKFSDRPINSITTAPPYAFSSFEPSKFSKYSSAAADSWSYWRQKSYYCSFCRREFQTAQALGGHMNVHRLDRAMMKLASSSNLNPSTSLECNPNPNLNSSSGYSQSTSEENCSKNDFEEVSMNLKLGRESWVGEMDYRKRKEFCVGYDIISNKKQKKTTDLLLALSCTSYEDEICKSDQGVKFGQMKVEEVDLELRLGDPPKVLKQSCNVVLIE